MYQQPMSYMISTEGAHFEVHESRVLRFDGIKPVDDFVGGHKGTTKIGGIPVLSPILRTITQHEATTSAVAHLVQEMSIPVIKLENFQETMASMNATSAGAAGSDLEVSPQKYAETINHYKSNFKTMFLGKNDEMTRLAVQFSGIKDIFDHMVLCLAAAADIPATRFFGKSPAGMNATGESDMMNYAIMVAAQQVRMLTKPLFKLDQVLARDAGLQIPPSYRWQPMVQVSDKEQAEAIQIVSQAVMNNLASGTMDEMEGRKVLDIYLPPEAGFDPESMPELTYQPELNS